MPQEVKEAYLKTAKDLGCDTSELIWVKHN